MTAQRSEDVIATHSTVIHAPTVLSTDDKDEIYAFLRRDPIWAAYAIGDLELAFFARCRWYLARRGAATEALALVYEGLEPPILLTCGSQSGIEAIFREVSLPEAISMSAPVSHLALFEAHYDFSRDRVRPMLRLTARPEQFRPVDAAGVCRVGEERLAELEWLYGHGGAFAPDAFSPSQLREGVFFGLDGPGESGCRSLVAVAGTHLVAPVWGVGAVGNVYTHPACRGRGYAAAVTSAVVLELLERGLLVVLNVDQANTAAIGLYRKLGFRVYCPFYEGLGVKWL